jgi:hypothetical protein
MKMIGGASNKFWTSVENIDAFFIWSTVLSVVFSSEVNISRNLNLMTMGWMITLDEIGFNTEKTATYSS